MAKVEGSNPFIRLKRKPCESQGFLHSRATRVEQLLSLLRVIRWV